MNKTTKEGLEEWFDMDIIIKELLKEISKNEPIKQHKKIVERAINLLENLVKNSTLINNKEILVLKPNTSLDNETETTFKMLCNIFSQRRDYLENKYKPKDGVELHYLNKKLLTRKNIIVWADCILKTLELSMKKNDYQKYFEKNKILPKILAITGLVSLPVLYSINNKKNKNNDKKDNKKNKKNDKKDKK